MAMRGQIFKKNILAQHPVILGLFSGAGGRFILYRPGMPPLDAPSVPIVYQLLKSIGHSTMALAEVVVPYHPNSPNDLTWRGPVAAYRNRMQSALDGLDAVPIRDDWKPISRSILQNNIAFMDDCLKNNVIAPEALQEFAKKQSPLLQGEHRLGGADPGRALDGRDRRLEADARRRLEEDLRAPATRYYDCPSEQHPIQRACPVLRAAGD